MMRLVRVTTRFMTMGVLGRSSPAGSIVLDFGDDAGRFRALAEATAGRLALSPDDLTPSPGAQYRDSARVPEDLTAHSNVGFRGGRHRACRGMDRPRGGVPARGAGCVPYYPLHGMSLVELFGWVHHSTT